MKRFILIGLLVASAGCASLPVKQQATEKLVATERLLATAQDTERALCSPTADKSKPITHCDGSVAATVGLTDARHQATASAFAIAFTAQVKAATALRAWKAGDPPPTDVATLSADITAALTLAKQLSGSPDVQKIATTLQQAIDTVTAVLSSLGGK